MIDESDCCIGTRFEIFSFIISVRVSVIVGAGINLGSLAANSDDDDEGDESSLKLEMFVKPLNF